MLAFNLREQAVVNNFASQPNLTAILDSLFRFSRRFFSSKNFPVFIIRNALRSKTVKLQSNFNVKSVPVYTTETHLEQKYTHRTTLCNFSTMWSTWLASRAGGFTLGCETPPPWYPFRSLGEADNRSGRLRKQNNLLFLQGIKQ